MHAHTDTVKNCFLQLHSLFLVQVLKQYIYVQYRAFIPPRSAWMMSSANIIISLAPGAQIIVKNVINVIIKSHSNLCFRNQEYSPFPYVLVYCCCEDTPEGQASGRKDWLLFAVSRSSLYGQLAPFVWGQKCSRISSREDVGRELLRSGQLRSREEEHSGQGTRYTLKAMDPWQPGSSHYTLPPTVHCLPTVYSCFF